MTRKVLVNIALLLVTLGVAFGIGELVVRWLYADEATLFPRYHTDYRYGKYVLRGIRPNSDFWHTSVNGHWEFITNSRGFRNDREFAYAKPKGTLRVLSIGDSQTQGYEVRQDGTFSATLERALIARGYQAEVINAGVSGFSNAEELAFVENEGYRYEPDVIVLGFFANDYEDNLKAGLFDVDEHGELVERKHEHIPGVAIQNFIYGVPGVQWLSEHSYFYSLLFNEAWEFFKVRATAAARDDARPAVTSETSNLKEQLDEFEYALPSGATVTPYQTELATKLLQRLKSFCAANGIRLIVVDIPDFMGPRKFRPSLAPEVVAALHAFAIEYIATSEILADFQGVVETHVSHGANHINELTHAIIGIELARRIAPTGSVPLTH